MGACRGNVANAQWILVGDASQADAVGSPNCVNMTESAVHHVPVYQRNHNTTITIESNTAFPATVESINWEGRYATNYYRRA